MTSVSGQKHWHPYRSRTDTEYILASVKEQEIQFEKLTKQLEEEHNTVAHQLEKCKIVDQAKDSTRSFGEEQEESDTESRQGSMPQRETRAAFNQEANYVQPRSPTLQYGITAASNNDNPAHSKYSDARRSPVKMMRPHMHSLNDYQQQHQAPDSNHLPGQPIQALHYAYRPNSVIPVEDPGSPSYPTYFSPPATTTSVPHRHRQSDHLHVARNNGRYANEKLHMRSHAVQHHPNTQPFNLRRQRNPHSPTYIYYPQERYYPPRLYYPLPHQLHHYPSYPAYSSYHVPSVQTKVNVPPPLPPRDSPYLYRPQELKPVSDPYYQHARAMQSDYQNLPAISPVNHPMIARDHHHNERSHFHFNNVGSHQPIESTPVYHANVATKPPSKRSERHVAISPQPTKRPTELRTVSPRIEINGDPDVIDVIHMLRHPSYEIVANAAAYLQHISYGNDKIKTIIREHGVLPLLVNLLHHHILDVQQNACGALRNMVFGKSNDEAKLMVRNCGGIASLSHVLRLTDDQEMKELITGVLWNLSSCDQLKVSIADSAMPVLASRIIIYYVSMLDPIRMGRYTPRDLHDSLHDLTHSDLTIDPQWATIFINATGCLRNISSAGVEVRSKMRSHEGLIEALLLIIENVIGKNDVDSKGVENCTCILRNLSYRLAWEVEAANIPITRSADGQGCTKDEECWRRSKKKDKKREKEGEILLATSRSRSPSQISIHGVEMLWQPGIVRRYLALLAETCNPGTLEAATGALQNLSAGQWVWSENMRIAVRKEKGLPMLVEFLHMDNQRIVTAMCSTLRNMALDDRNKQLIGKHATGDFVNLLPEVDSSSDDVINQKELEDLPSVANLQNVLLYEAVCCALKELVTTNVDNATLLYEAGAIPKLVEISRGGGYRYPHRLVKSAGRVLATLWEYKNLRSIFKQHGWSQFHFNVSGVPSVASVGSQISPFSSPPLSPSDTSKETNYSPKYSKIPSHPPATQELHNPRPALPYAPMSSQFHSPHADSNYVMMLRKDDKVLAESLV